MKRASLLLLIPLSIIFFLIPVYIPDIIHAGGSPLNIELLSDHSLTEADTFFNIYGYNIVTHGSVAHLYWQETGNGTEGTDLFYRRVPGGSTIHLSDPTRSDGDVNHFWFDTAVAPDGTFHMIWLEDTNTTEAGDLFYWSSATGTLLLSDHSQTEGYVQPAQHTLNLILDNDGTPHVIWYEETGTDEGEDLFYWNPITGTRRLTDRSQTQGSDVNYGPNNLIIAENGTAHVTWAEYGNDGLTAVYFYWNSTLATPTVLPNIKAFTVAGNEAHIFWFFGSDGPIYYWNSATTSETTIQASPESTNSFILGFATRTDSNNTVHIFWSEPGTSVCLSHWDTTNKTTEAVALGENCEPFSRLVMDSSDRFHAVVIDVPGGTSGQRFRYWRSDLTELVEIKTVENFANNPQLSVFNGNSPAHFTWIETDNSTTPPDHNLFHWDSTTLSTNNLSQSTGPATPISSWQVDMNQIGNLHALWFEQNSSTGTYQNFYWNSATSITQNLFSELGISSINLLNNNIEDMRMDFMNNGDPYFMWHGSLASGPEGLYLWDSQKDTTHLAGESMPCSEVGRSYKNVADDFGNIYLAWQDDISKVNYFWSADTGQINLNQTTTAESICHPPVLTVSENGNVFMMWVEESDTAAEGLDIFGGWIQSSTSNTYLPLVTK